MRAPVLGLCSIILPTFDRAAFLPDAIAAIREQQYTHWELIVVDDGSTDETRTVLADLVGALAQPTRYVYQSNHGPGAARNRGIDLAAGEYIAFYDSDDLWLPHHLVSCIDALASNLELTWVYGAMRSVEYPANRIVQRHTFYEEPGSPKPFLRLRTRQKGALRIIDDSDAGRCAIAYGLHSGLGASVMRRSLFDDGLRIPDLRIGEDRCFSIQALKRAAIVGYLDDVHVIARIHVANSSAASRDQPLARRLEVERHLIEAYEFIQDNEVLHSGERRALYRKIADERFWMLGYSLLWQNGRGREAVSEYWRALRVWPWDPWMWKTFLLARLRLLLRGLRAHCRPD